MSAGAAPRARDMRPDTTNATSLDALAMNAGPCGTAKPDREDVAADPGPLLRLVRRQEIAFAIVGMVNTGLGMSLTVMWLVLLGHRVPAAVAPAAAYAVSVVIAFVLHRSLVFRVRGRLIRDFVAFVAVNSGGLLMNMVLLQVGVSVLHLPSIPSAVAVMALVAVASFFGHRHVSFRRTSALGTDGSRSVPAGR
ncbi:GtrA family protein [Nocardia sp. NBC_00508]|uniref:GtrA family protein n=1 Tax=Nocardia sp. NBC_00508 TaxID=2975992 RepID=UPI002E812228|nr:GtrA family protein [Nocardia sp. NBC_00508]WUD67406.1 GtrA family protein [Nocardia sp. NBC_00508]